MMFTLQLSDLSTYHHFLAIIVCNPPLLKCYLGECDTRPDVMKLKEKLITNVDENDVDKIVYKQWVSTDRSNVLCAS